MIQGRLEPGLVCLFLKHAYENWQILPRNFRELVEMIGKFFPLVLNPSYQVPNEVLYLTFKEYRGYN